MLRKLGSKRKVAGRRRNVRRYRKRRGARQNGHSTGYMKIVRKCPEFWLQNTGVAGVARLAWIPTPGASEASYTGTVATIGTPTPGMNGAYDVPFSMNFRLSDLTQYLEVAQIADQYKIKSIHIRLMPSFTQNPISGLYNYPQLYWVQDDDDAGILAVDVLRAKQSLKTCTFKPGQYITITLRNPKYQMTVQDSTGTTNAIVNNNNWINSSSVNVPHFGIKGYVGNIDLPTTTTSKFGIKFDVAYVVEARGFQ